MPTIDNVLYKLSKAHKFTLVSARNKFLQCKLDRKCSLLITFWTLWDRRHWLKWSFGTTVHRSVSEEATWDTDSIKWCWANYRWYIDQWLWSFTRGDHLGLWCQTQCSHGPPQRSWDWVSISCKSSSRRYASMGMCCQQRAVEQPSKRWGPFRQCQQPQMQKGCKD